MKKILFLTLISTTFFACQSNKEENQNLEQIDKKSAREVVLSTKTVAILSCILQNKKYGLTIW